MTRRRSSVGLSLTLTVLAALANFPSASADELFVADRATDRILSFDPVTGEFLRVVLDEGLSLPTSLALSPFGELFVGNLGSGQILKVNPVTGDAEFFAIMGGPGGLVYDAGALPNDSSDDLLYVSEFGNFDGNKVHRYDAQGNEIYDLDEEENPVRIGDGTSASGRSGLALRNGALYVSVFGEGEFFSGSVIAYDVDDDYAPLGPFAVSFDPFLSGANGIAFDSEGDLYVAGLLNQGVIKFDTSEGPAFSGTAFGGFPIPYASAIVVAQEGETEVVYVTSLGNDNPGDPIYGGFLFPGAIYKFDAATGNLIGGAPLVSSGGDSDHDDDGDVDGDDLAEWKIAFGDGNGADADNDGDSDGADFLTWQRNVGKIGDFQPTAAVLYPTMTAGEPVPEPSGAVLVALAAAGAASVRRRRRR